MDCSTKVQVTDTKVIKLDANGMIVVPEMPETMATDLAPLFERLSQLTSAIPQMMAIQSAHELGRMYRPVGGGELRRNEDGTYTPVLRDENGKITKHVPLERGSVMEEAAKIGWAITSVAVGQAHLMNISDELTKLNNKMDEFKQIAYDRDISKVEASIRSLARIDFRNDIDSKKMMHDDCRALDEGCSALHKALCREVKAMPTTDAMKINEGWFGGLKAHRPEEAEIRFRTILQLLPIYLRGMFVLTVMNVYRNGSSENPEERLMSQLQALVEDSGLVEKVKMVPMISVLDEAPEKVVEKLLAAVRPTRG